jgi:hypothetical protein
MFSFPALQKHTKDAEVFIARVTAAPGIFMKMLKYVSENKKAY